MGEINKYSLRYLGLCMARVTASGSLQNYLATSIYALISVQHRRIDGVFYPVMERSLKQLWKFVLLNAYQV
jgi:hypothetical protein